jgi:hypothetical protein
MHKTLKEQHPEANPAKTNEQVQKFISSIAKSAWEHYKQFYNNNNISALNQQING